MIRRVAVAALVSVALLLAGCGGTSSSQPSASGSGSSASSPGPTSVSPSPSPSASSSATVVVQGVRLTPQGTRLKLGDTARVSWKPNQHTTGVIGVKVTGLLKVPISNFSAWRLSREIRRSTPYFVHATVRNLGRSDLSRVPVPLYLLDQRQTLLEASSFQASFAPCPSLPLPAKFRRGDKASVCLVYFVPHHGKLVAVSFRPQQDFDAITWRGRVVSASGG